MAIENKELVREYHKKLTDIKLRIPSSEIVGVDYLSMMKDKAKEKGFINTKGAEKGKGNVNAYILDLVSKDLGIEIINSVKDKKED